MNCGNLRDKGRCRNVLVFNLILLEMKKLKLTSLVEKELLNIKGGESGGGGSTTCTCDSCSCDCGGGDTTYNQSFSNFSSGATSSSSLNSSIIK